LLTKAAATSAILTNQRYFAANLGERTYANRWDISCLLFGPRSVRWQLVATRFYTMKSRLVYWFAVGLLVLAQFQDHWWKGQELFD
jgi:hypothetical protein